jgi:hypothetical protein
VAASTAIPFAVGTSPWKNKGDPCTTSPDCYTPAAPTSCQNGICKRQCASDYVDCGPGGYCEPPNPTGIRTCAW